MIELEIEGLASPGQESPFVAQGPQNLADCLLFYKSRSSVMSSSFLIGSNNHCLHDMGLENLLEILGRFKITFWFVLG